jgi:hypothetical protein
MPCPHAPTACMHACRAVPAEHLEGSGDCSPPGVSPARRSRKAALMGGDLTGKSIIKATLDVSQLEQEMVGASSSAWQGRI